MSQQHRHRPPSTQTSKSADSESSISTESFTVIQAPPLLPTDEQVLSLPVCHICAEHVRYWAVAECNHPVCHICAVRLRVLYKNYACPMCKAQNKVVAVVKAHSASEPPTFQQWKFHCRQWSNLHGIHFQEAKVKLAMEALLQWTCPHPDCLQRLEAGDVIAATVTFPSREVLRQHVRSQHQLLLCEVCGQHRRLFARELSLYSKSALALHTKQGDALVPHGHPQCEFCRSLFYHNDDLYEHCRQKHEQCHLCHQQGIKHAYYRDYEALEVHFGDAHFICKESQCLAEKFVVFATQLDLQAHHLERHLQQQQKTGQRSHQMRARTVPLSFNYGSSNNSNNSNNRNSNTNNNNNIQASLQEVESRLSQISTQEPEQVTPPTPPAPPTPESALISLIRQVLNGNEQKFNQFKQWSQSFRRQELDADIYYRHTLSLFGAEGVQQILPTLMSSLPDAGRRQALMAARSRYEKLSEDFPTLSGVGPSNANANSNISASHGNVRVLVLKGSKAAGTLPKKKSVKKHATNNTVVAASLSNSSIPTTAPIASSSSSIAASTLSVAPSWNSISISDSFTLGTPLPANNNTNANTNNLSDNRKHVADSGWPSRTASADFISDESFPALPSTSRSVTTTTTPAADATAASSEEPLPVVTTRKGKRVLLHFG